MVRKGCYSEEDLKEAVEKSMCISDVCKILNITVCSYNYIRIKKLCLEYNIKYDHFDIKQTFKRGKFEWDEISALCNNSPLARCQLRPLLIRLGYYTGKCSECGITDWNGKPLTIEIDHIDGISENNELTNLRWLCPNCHSQTETFRNSRARRARKTE
jgi:Zn finger protein HypA/HybF involved in hydrogenase expression